MIGDFLRGVGSLISVETRGTDPKESGFDTSGLLVSKESRRIRETPSCDGFHGDSVWY
jgi:hypothetical protein